MKKRIITEQENQSKHQYSKTTNQKIDFVELIHLKKKYPDAKLRELAEFFGCSVQAIYRVQKKYDLPQRPATRYLKKVDPEELRKHIETNPNATLNDLGKFFGCRGESVSGMIRRHKIPYQKKTNRGQRFTRKVDPKELKKYIESNPNSSLEEIAKYFCCTHPSISSALKRDGISYQPKCTTKIDIEDLKKRIKENPSAKLKELAKPYGCSVVSVSKMIKRHNIPYKSKNKKQERKPNANKANDSHHIDIFKQINAPIQLFVDDQDIKTDEEQKTTHQVKKKYNYKIDPEELKKLINENPNATQKELADKLGCTDQSVSRMLIQHKIPYKSKLKCDHKIDRDKLRRLIMRNPDMTAEELAEEFDCTPDAIKKAAKRHNIPYKPKWKKLIDVDELKRLIRKTPVLHLKN